MLISTIRNARKHLQTLQCNVITPLTVITKQYNPLYSTANNKQETGDQGPRKGMECNIVVTLSFTGIYKITKRTVN